MRHSIALQIAYTIEQAARKRQAKKASQTGFAKQQHVSGTQESSVRNWWSAVTVLCRMQDAMDCRDNGSEHCCSVLICVTLGQEVHCDG